MNALRVGPRPTASAASHLLLVAREPESPWEARGLTDLVPPATLAEARAHREDLARLRRREREAAADFLLALADFDRRRGWEQLGHASLFAFLTRELGLSSGAAQLRLSAARLLPRHAAVEAALRSGRLCISAVGQLARVLTLENEREVLPRFLGLSAREAKELAASILPCPAPPLREVVTPAVVSSPAPAPLAIPVAGPRPQEVQVQPRQLRAAAAPLHTCEVPAPAPVSMPLATVEPLTADLRRLHLTVSSRLLEKVAKAKEGLSHAVPGASTEQVLETALDLLLERQAQRKALAKRPTTTSTPPAASTSPRKPGRPHVPAAIAREVRLRDADRCQFPLDAGGICGSTWQVELDHVVPLALGGPTTAANLRCCCRTHNQRAAEDELGTAARTRRR
jgi:hypothetical protein